MACKGVAGQLASNALGLAGRLFVLAMIPGVLFGCAEIDEDEHREGEAAEAASPITYNVTSLGTPRRYATATVLGNGKVLVAGGSDATNTFTTAEVYDPATDQWSATGVMTGSPPNRDRHTATLLSPTKVMVVGGLNGMGVNNTSSIYNASTNTWSAGPNMSKYRYGHTATTLNDGRVLVVGGYGAGTYHKSAEIYNPVTNSWSSVANMTFARYGHSATLLDDGRVLIVGGTSGTYLASVGSSEIYNPTTGTWSTGPQLNTARYAHLATKLVDKCVLVVGGVDTSQNVPGAERYCPNKVGFEAIAGNAAKRVEPTMVTLSDNRVLVAGGRGTAGNVLSNADIYDPVTNTWQSTDMLQTARSQHVAVRLNGDRVLMIGGTGASSNTLANVEISRLAIDGNLGSALPTFVTGTTCLGKDDFAPPSSCASFHNEDRAFLWTAPLPGHYEFSTVDALFPLDTVVYVQDARTDALLSTINGQPACNDDHLGSLQSTVVTNLAAGQRVQVIVDGFGVDKCGDFKLSVSARCQIGLSCNTGQPGVCATGTTQCNADSTQACVRNTNPSSEVCNDNLDNDCDGLVDEGCCTLACEDGPNEGQPCLSAANCKGYACTCYSID